MGARVLRILLARASERGDGEGKERGYARRFSGVVGSLVPGADQAALGRSQHSFVVPLARAGPRSSSTAELRIGIGRDARLWPLSEKLIRS